MKYFLPCRIVAEIMQQVHQSQQIAAAQLAAQPPVPGPGSVAPPPTAPPADGSGGVTPPPTAPPADGSAGVTPMAGATAPADGSAWCNTHGWCYCSSSRWDWSWNSPCSFVCSPMPEMRGCGEMFYFREGCCLNSKCEAWPCLAFFSMWGGYGSMF